MVQRMTGLPSTTLSQNTFEPFFYSTHNFFPSYAPNIGAGENIYSLSYYGLYSPIIILSYFLPFVPMSYYIIATSVLSAFFSQKGFYIISFVENTALL